MIPILIGYLLYITKAYTVLFDIVFGELAASSVWDAVGVAGASPGVACAIVCPSDHVRTQNSIVYL